MRSGSWPIRQFSNCSQFIAAGVCSFGIANTCDRCIHWTPLDMAELRDRERYLNTNGTYFMKILNTLLILILHKSSLGPLSTVER